MRFIKLFILIIFVIGIFNGNIHSKISSRVEGVVVDEETGNPIEKAKVFLFTQFPDDDEYMDLIENFITKKNGKFKFNIEDPGRYCVFVMKDNYVPFGPYMNIFPILSSDIRKQIVGGDISLLLDSQMFISAKDSIFYYVKKGQKKYLKIRMKKHSPLKIRVTRKMQSKIIPDSKANITIFHPNFAEGLDVYLNDQGEYNSCYFNSGAARIEIRVNGYPDKVFTVNLEDGKNTIIDFVLDFTKDQVVYGNIREKASGKPMRVSISLYGNNTGTGTTSNKNGEYWIGGIDSGNYTIKLKWNVIDSVTNKYKSKSLTKNIILKPNEKLNLDFEI